ncbi:zf-HC2 domain-containing protein [Streptomyces sp. WZ-12]|uniref:zf-HC2 domain-containing protein n=1 Tax=Streptomyces sp. WZ-12 TaxID=3030210 RepID=UPI0023817DAC|nr:zf-HC2 domain-containing protein [Streptomyces sp. WZ-12]
MLCSRIRTALSARLDGEALPPGLTARRLDDHLSGCRGCRQWDARARALTVVVGSAAGHDDEMAAPPVAGGGPPQASVEPTQASLEPAPEPFESTSASVEALLARLRSGRRAG